jgi:hypothetical protein
MKLSDFEWLSKGEQITVLYREGVYIGKKKIGQYTGLMFQLESFYVEIIYADYRKVIFKIRCSDYTTILEPYLEQIDVEYLVT